MAEGGQIGRAVNSTENRGPSISAATAPNERETAGPSTMMARWAALERHLEVKAASRQMLDEEGKVLQAWNDYLAETAYERELAGPWASRIDGLCEDREIVSAARRVSRERRVAEARAAQRKASRGP